MLVTNLLRAKGAKSATVVTMPPDATVHELLELLAEHAIGAVVVSARAGRVDGIVSERDVVRRLLELGVALLDAPVSQIMTTEVATCVLETSVEDLMALMTDRRIRHVPVEDDGQLVGIVSIGDVVKARIVELTGERDDLVSYIGTR